MHLKWNWSAISTVRKRSCGKVFSLVSVIQCRGRVPMGPLPMTHRDMGTNPTPHISYPILHTLSPYPTPSHIPCCWHLVAITGELFKLVHLRTCPPTGTDILWWPPKRAVRILLECYLVSAVFDLALMQRENPQHLKTSKYCFNPEKIYKPFLVFVNLF